MPEFLDVAAVAELLGVSTATVRSYSSRAHQGAKSPDTVNPFPAPAIRVSGSPGWNRADILRWAAQRPGKGKGPRPNRRVDALSRLEVWKMRQENLGESTDRIPAYDLGRVLGRITADDVVTLAKAGGIPVRPTFARLHNRPENQLTASFEYTRVLAWLERDQLRFAS